MKAINAFLGAVVLLYVLGDVKCSVIGYEPEDVREGEALVSGRILDKVIETLINGYEMASQILHDMLDKHDETGILSHMFEKLQEELEKLKDFILGRGHLRSLELEEIERNLEMLREEHRRIHADFGNVHGMDGERGMNEEHGMDGEHGRMEENGGRHEGGRHNEGDRHFDNEGEDEDF